MDKECIQHCLGWIVVKITRAYKVPVPYPPFSYWRPRRFRSSKWGVCLGSKYIICVNPSRITLAHEYGHALQSKRLKWLYLFTVGVVSITRNIWDRIAHRKWSKLDRLIWYYAGWPEHEADILGTTYEGE